MTEFLTVVQLEKLKIHKYQREGENICERLFLQTFWGGLLKFVPLSWAPNSMTLAGLFGNVFSALILVFCSTDGLAIWVPPWALIFAALCLFLYQCLDALDGKQARRTGSASPLGELFDHGCDAVSTGAVTWSMIVAMRMGSHPNLMFVYGLTTAIVYYTGHWRAYCTGCLKFGTIDVTELQFLAMFNLIVTALVPSNTLVWSTLVPIPFTGGVELKVLMLTGFMCAAVGYVTDVVYYVCVHGGVGRRSTTVANSSVLSPAPPFLVALLLVYYARSNSMDAMFENYPIAFLAMYLFVAAKLTCRLLVASMTKSEIPQLDSSLLSLFLVAGSVYTRLLPETTALFIACAYALVDFFKYASSVCRQIADALGVYCFSLQKPPQRSSPIVPSPNQSPSLSNANAHPTTRAQAAKFQSNLGYKPG